MGVSCMVSDQGGGGGGGGVGRGITTLRQSLNACLSMFVSVCAGLADDQADADV